MADLGALQRKFVDYLRHADMTIADDIVGGTSEERARRLSIYYNAYRIRLRASIETDHPVLGVYLGDDGFERMAAAFIDQHPSCETSLRHFCDALPDFLRLQAPFSGIGMLAELARFERLLMEAFDAADADQAGDDFLSSLPAEQWPGLVLQLHPSVHSYVSSWNSVDIWRAIKAERTPPDAQQGEKSAWLLWRNRELLTEFRSLSVDEYSMLVSVLNGECFAQVCESMLEWHREDQAAARVLSILRDWIGSGLIVTQSNTTPASLLS